VSKKVIADVSEACIGAGILSTLNLFGGLQIIKTLHILSEFDFSKRKIHFKGLIGPEEGKMEIMIQSVNQNFEATYADILNHSKLKSTKKELKPWLLK
jgi:hypothetical protein